MYITSNKNVSENLSINRCSFSQVIVAGYRPLSILYTRIVYRILIYIKKISWRYYFVSFYYTFLYLRIISAYNLFYLNYTMSLFFSTKPNVFYIKQILPTCHCHCSMSIVSEFIQTKNLMCRIKSKIFLLSEAFCVWEYMGKKPLNIWDLTNLLPLSIVIGIFIYVLLYSLPYPFI